MLRILLIAVALGLYWGSVTVSAQVIVVPRDADVRLMPSGPNVHQNHHAVGVGHSYYWGDPRLGRGMPGWPANPRLGFQQGASMFYGGTGIGGTVLNGYHLAVWDQTQNSFVTSVVPVVGGYSRYDSPTNRRVHPGLPPLSNGSMNQTKRQILRATK